ncbi:MAG: DNA polymerase III subunit beta [Peptococcaceae bacterium]|jgi:DNA polymerase-3 subunit beta|nr:DNA polymerase III subunit beta [Peptococcaceae bacterium]MDH7523827.1 DNA polymerase III subunit beta [Peptococcaceae bacterium]
MKITATKENLLFGVSAVQKAVSTKTTLPILSCIRIEARENSLYFSATDLEIGIECHVPVEVIEEGIVIVPAKHFSEIIRKLPESPIKMMQENENLLTITYEESQLVLKTFSDSDFPSIPDVKGEQEIIIKSACFKQMIRQTVFSAGTDEIKLIFSGVLFEGEGDVLRMISTDTHRLALRQGKILNNIELMESFIIPAKILIELARLIHDEDETCYITVTKNLACFKTANIRIITRLLEGQFPNYRQVIPTNYSAKIKASNKRFSDAVERISLFTLLQDTSNTINISIENNTMIISSQSEIGQGYEQIAVEKEGEPVNISFNARYLLDVFKVIEEDTVSLDFTGPLSPCIVRPVDNESFIYLLLPVRT